MGVWVKDIGIDLGTANTLIKIAGEEGILNCKIKRLRKLYEVFTKLYTFIVLFSFCL